MHNCFIVVDNQSQRFDNTRTTEQERREHLKEQVERGNLSPDEAEEMNEWMDDTNRDCHGRDSFSKREMWDMGRQHHRMMD